MTRHLGTCQGCRRVVSVIDPTSRFAKCPTCNRWVKLTRVKGVVSQSRRCDSRCTSARGPDCVCQCGGANHGAGWDGGAVPVPLPSLPKPTYRKNNAGTWVVYGPAALVLAGQEVEVTKRDGSTKTERIASVGRPFAVDGIAHVYGYVEARQAATT